jgi:hypothetical protein
MRDQERVPVKVENTDTTTGAGNADHFSKSHS